MTPTETCPKCGANVDLPPSKINPTFTVFKCGSIDEDGKHGQSLECELAVATRQRNLLLELLDDESIIESLAGKYLTSGPDDEAMIRIRTRAMTDYAKYLRKKYQEKRAAQDVPA